MGGAAAEGHLSCVKTLKTHGATIELATKKGKTALLLAALFGREEICKYLFAVNAKIDARDDEKQTALFGAVYAGNHTLAQFLIEKGCPLEAESSCAQTALICAAQWQQLECVKLLIDAQANIYHRDDANQLAIDIAESTLNSH